MSEGQTGRTAPDTEKFRLRRFVDGLIGSQEIEVCEEKLDLADLAARLDGNPKAVLFRHAGPEQAEIVGNLMGGRSRLAAAFGVSGDGLLHEVLRRLDTPQPIVELAASAAPVQQVVWTGDDADFTRLPVPFQHGRDGGPYLSATIDYTTDPETGLTNVGCRRLMLRDRREAGIDLTSPSDLKAIYEAAAGRGEALPVSFALGAHPTDHMAATMRVPGDETGLVARMRGATLAVVKCVTNDIRVPADAEMIVEGYIDPRGHVEDEGDFSLEIALKPTENVGSTDGNFGPGSQTGSHFGLRPRARAGESGRVGRGPCGRTQQSARIRRAFRRSCQLAHPPSAGCRLTSGWRCSPPPWPAGSTSLYDPIG